MASASAGRARRMTVPLATAPLAAEGSDIGQLEPEEVVGAQREQIRQIADVREVDPADELDRDTAAIAREVELDVLREAREVRDAEDRDSLVLSHVGEDPPVLRVAELEGPASEHRVLTPDAEHPLRPVQQRSGDSLLGLDVDRLVAVDRVGDEWGVEGMHVGLAEPGVAVA